MWSAISPPSRTIAVKQTYFAARGQSVSTDISDLVALVYRTDWKQLSLSATISHTSDPAVRRRLRERKTAELRRLLGPLPEALRVREVDHPVGGPVHSERHLLVAPGGRYRVESGHGRLDVCDGEHRWHCSDGVARRDPRSGPGAKLHGLLTPRWLIACYDDLQVTGSEVAGDRQAIRVTGVPRTASARRHGYYQFLDGVEVLVDVELGILLSSRQIFDGETAESAELHDLVINPPETEMSGMFVLPPDAEVDDEEPFADFQAPGGVGWQVAGAAAGATANALGFAVRHAPRRKPVWPADDEEPDMPGDAVLAPEAWEHRQPPDDRTVNLLHRTGLPTPALTAQVHEWMDVLPRIQHLKARLEKMPAPFEGILGPDALWDALGERAAEDGGGHRVARLAVRVPGHYRIDFSSGDWNKRYKAIACDGEHTTKLFDDKVASGPVKPLDASFAAMLDPAWLLNGWRLGVVGPASVAGRDGIRIRAVSERTVDDGADNLFTRADVVLDPELGVLLRNTTYVKDQPVTRMELRDLRPLDDKASFRIVPEPGMRSVTDSGGPFGDRNLPRPAEAAATAATLAAAGAVAVSGWLEKHRARRDRR